MWTLKTSRRAAPWLLSLWLSPLGCGGDEKGGPAGQGGAPAAGGSGLGGVVLAGGSPGAGGACGEIGAACTRAGDCCEPNAVCNQSDQAVDRRGCQKRCTTGGECDTGCCLLFQNQTFGFCTDAKWCACGAEGARCGGNNPACCSDQACVGGDPAGTFFECRPSCTGNTDCATACCVEIATGLKACLDAATYCP